MSDRVSIACSRATVRGCAALAFAVCSLAACGGPVHPERIVLIVVDTLRRDHVGVYGDGRLTPNIDALAARGQVFRRFHASFHQTSMSMGSLFTGRTPSFDSGDPARTLPYNGSTWCGMARFADADEDGLCIPEALPTLAEAMRDEGFWTIGIASNRFLFSPSGFERGFDDWTEVGEVPDESRFAQSEPWASRRAGAVNRSTVEALNRRPNDRFFLYVHYMESHDYGFRDVSYASSVTDADSAIGALLANLEQARLLDGATIFVTSDHGESLGEPHPLPSRGSHVGNPSFQELLEAPLIVAPPIDADPDAFLRTQDLRGLITAAVGFASPLDRDLAPEELYLGELRYLTYRNGRYKSAMRRDGTRFALFDLDDDPRETRDVSALHPDVARRHRERSISLARSFGTDHTTRGELSDDDRRRLRSLGYLEPEP